MVTQTSQRVLHSQLEQKLLNRAPQLEILSLIMLPHINDTCRSGYYHLRRINKFRKYLSDCGTKTIIQALVISRMDYCNSIYHGLSIKSLKKFQLVQNAAARVITKTKRHTDYKMIGLTFNALNEQGPSYIADFFKLYKPKRSDQKATHPVVPVHGRSIQINKRLLNYKISTTKTLFFFNI